jgi:hypothetical protein
MVQRAYRARKVWRQDNPETPITGFIALLLLSPKLVATKLNDQYAHEARRKIKVQDSAD